MTEASARRGTYLVLAAALAAHVASLRAGWVLDDWELLVDNPYLRSPRGLHALLTSELFVASGDPRHFPYYRPVSGFVYWLTYQLFGGSGVLHHAFNVALHALASVLFFHLARRLKVSARGALVLGLLFAVHPIGVEAVAYAGGRQDVLGWVLTFGTMLLLLRAPPSPRMFVLSFVGTLLAALTRELFLAAPALHVLAATFAIDEAAQSKRSRPRAALATASGGAIAIASVLGLRRALAITPFDTKLEASKTLGAFAAVLLRFVKDVFLPTDIAVDVTILPLGTGAALVVIALAMAAFALAFVTVKKRARALLSAFVVGSVAFALLVVLHTPVALRFGIISDRYAYGAVAALLLAVAPAIDAVVARVDASKTKMFAFVVAAMTIAILPLTWARAADYANDQTLALALVRERPDDPRALLSQIVTLRGAGQGEEAYPLCHRYAELLPEDIVVNSCLAEEAVAAKDDARAVKLLEPWLRAQPKDARSRALYLQALFRLGDLARVKTELERFEAIDPNAPDLKTAREALSRDRAE